MGYLHFATCLLTISGHWKTKEEMELLITQLGELIAVKDFNMSSSSSVDSAFPTLSYNPKS